LFSVVGVLGCQTLHYACPFVAIFNIKLFIQFNILKKSLIIHEENTKKNHKRVVSVYVIQIHVDLHKL
jgi:hypothetical protein